ncbi:MAG: hypothetical protein U0793_07915 [Gemmataceae bacterium]
MSWKGRIREGKIVLEGDVPLPEGAEVVVEVIEPKAASFFDMGKQAVPTGIKDLARNIDHYLYGHPKSDNGAE